MPEAAAALDRLASLCGIQPAFTDVFGNEHRVSDATKRALLHAMGIACDDLEQAEAAVAERRAREHRRLLPPVRVVREGEPLELPLNLDPGSWEARLDWTVIEQDGQVHHGHWQPEELPREAPEPGQAADARRRVRALLEIELPEGYHELQLRHGQRRASMPLILAPRRCHTPDAFADGARLWGLSAQLYSLRSHHNWGMGDFGDLPGLVERCAAEGGHAIGLNPLHAMFPHNPRHCSPYSPSSRLFLNVLYIDVTSCPEVEASRQARERMAAPAFRAALADCRAAELVDYPGIAALKQEILELAFGEFMGGAGQEQRRSAFEAFCASNGEALYRHALFEALQEHFHAEDPELWGWPAWPHAFRDPASAAVARFARSHADRIDFFRWLQWLADGQLAAVGRQAQDGHMAIGLYFDMAVSVDRGGAETWANQHLYALDASIGAPPDVFNARGQNWGLPPQNPLALRESGYALYIDTLQRLMRHGGAIRIDHVMMLLRLFWVPEGASPEDGAYVSYPMDDLLAILALESRRNRCLVIGEDLGTVPDEVRAALRDAGVLSYRLVYFEQHGPGEFKSPAEYPSQALVSVSTHDLPTWAGWWEGNDLRWRSRLGLFPSDDVERQQHSDRERDRAGLRRLLEEEQLLTDGADTVGLGHAVQRLLARSPAMLQMLQIEDALGVLEQVNLPSTVDEHPNWRRRLPVAQEELVRDANFLAAVDAIRAERGPEPGARRREAIQAPAVPRATYRLQLHHQYTFADARQLVPYLDALGISHCYTSPYLQSRPGSMHGYDTIDHGRIDPELGTLRDYQRWVDALRQRSMSHVADIVSNHMGVGADNAWWLDVLEHGQAARHAAFFDIDWEPAERALAGKLLLPVLGDVYGRVLESGELELVFDSEDKRFVIRYHEHRFPLDPREYPYVLVAQPQDGAATDVDGIEVPAELDSVAAAFRKLPPRSSTGEAAVTERYRDAEVLRERLLELYRTQPAIGRLVDERVRAINASAAMLHQLLDAQAWRLAHWRTASDEINYRRFFDINDLAALRAEDPEVFEDSHRRILELIESGAVGGLRIDHPDGLYDPAGYYRRLVARVREVLPPGTPPFYLVVEKILGAHEKLPEDWTVSGTTGYEFTYLLNGLQVDPAGQRPLTRTYARFVDQLTDFDRLLYECKHQVIRRSLASELQVLTNRLHTLAQNNPLTRDFTRGGLAEALREFTACFPVYRSYITSEDVSDQDRHHIDWAVAQAKRVSGFAELSAFDFLRDVLLQRNGGAVDPAERLDFTMKLQQFTSPVMAKAMEDTAFYRYHRLVSLNEVGGDPRRWGVSVSAFHHENLRRLASWPHSMLGTTTHDTKRSEDVRARINVLSEIPTEWQSRVRAWQRFNRRLVRKLDSGPAPSRNDEYLLYQTLLGSWPLGELDAQGLDDYAERIRAYALKAAREAKERTSWIQPDADYEAALDEFIGALLDPERGALFQADFLGFKQRVARVGLLNSLSQTLLKLTAPGVPDIYQGTELWSFSLVDPDNRRPVDYAQRARLLKELARAAGREPAPLDFDHLVDAEGGGRCKLDLIRRTLDVRRRLPELFEAGDYLPLDVQGAHADRLCAFARCSGDRLLVVVAPRLLYPLTDDASSIPLGDRWQDTRVLLPERFRAARWFTSVLDDARREAAEPQDHPEQHALAAAELFRSLPVALLVNARGVGA